MLLKALYAQISRLFSGTLIVPQILRFVIDSKMIDFTIQNSLWNQFRCGAYAPNINWRGYWYEKTAQKNSATKDRLFRYRCRAFIFYCGAAARNVRQNHFMLRKWQHRQVAPLAIQSPNKCGLCIGCAVLPAQRELLGCRLGRCFCLRQRCPPDTRTPPRPPRKQSVRS